MVGHLVAQDAVPMPSPMDRVTRSRVVMVEKAGTHELSPLAGAFATRAAFVTVLFYTDFPDATAQIHIRDAQPTFYLKVDADPRGRIFLVRADKSKRSRSVKLGKSGFGSISGMMVPDPDWTFEYSFKETSKEGIWEIKPKSSLKKGEYGIYMGGFASSAPSPGAGGNLFDCAVD